MRNEMLLIKKSQRHGCSRYASVWKLIFKHSDLPLVCYRNISKYKYSAVSYSAKHQSIYLKTKLDLADSNIVRSFAKNALSSIRANT